MTVDSDKLGYKLHPDRVQRWKNKTKQINWFLNNLFLLGVCSLYKSADKFIRVYSHLWLTIKSLSFSVNIECNFQVDIQNVDLNNSTRSITYKSIQKQVEEYKQKNSEQEIN